MGDMAHPVSPERALAAKLIESLGIATASDHFAAKEFFELTLAAMPADGSLPTDSAQLTGIRVAQEGLHQLRKHRRGLTEDGVLWIGRPDFLSDDRLQGIREELESRRPLAFEHRMGQFLCAGGEAVTHLLESKELHGLVESFVGPLTSKRQASCLYYDREGACIRPHVDTDLFCVNANLIVEHTGYTERRSQLIVYPLGGQPRPVVLSPGELVLFYADCIVHARTPLIARERMRVISFGFQPEKEFHK